VNANEFNTKQHWEEVYHGKSPDETSWFQTNPRISLSMIENTGFGVSAALIDIGGGASLLADHLLDRGYRDLTVLDISRAALDRAFRRLGEKSPSIDWLECDVTRFKPGRVFDIWHDRAAFHFLTLKEDRERYSAALRSALKPGGQAIIATFAPGGPERCSGLPVVRYDSDKLGAVLGPAFELEEQEDEAHRTPAGGEQQFRFFRFKKQT
jgi:SAM-dependent methyltransferase